jgi:rhamnogalacturonan endolyase
MKAFSTFLTGVFLSCFMTSVLGQFQMEDIYRAVVAVDYDTGIYVGWRLLGTDPDTIAFNVYRNDTKVNDVPITESTNYIDSLGTLTDEYYVIPVLGGVEQTSSDTVGVWNQNYLTVPLQRPPGGTTPGFVCTDGTGTRNYPDGQDYTYSPNDASVGDLDGDGEYEIVLKWDPSNSHDNAHCGYTGNTILDAYEMDGTLMWRIDLGVNVRSGAHYSPFMVYDLNNDGMAEVVCRTASGSKDGSGAFISDGPAASADHGADYRNSAGYILTGPEYLTVFNGSDGTEMVTVDLEPARGSVSSWGDSYGNRVDRFTAAIVHLGSGNPSVVWCRGIYAKMELAAWDLIGGELVLRWHFKTQEGYADWAGMGSHNLSVGDVDFDGKDEIVYGNCAIDDDGTGLWTLRNTIVGRATGDAGHLADIDPQRPGLEKWACGEGSGPGSFLVDARTGEVLWATEPGDVGRATAGDMVPEFLGMECWGGTDGLRSADNIRVGPNPYSTNHVVWWDGDLGRELLDGNNIRKYQGATLLQANDCSSNNGSKSNPCLQADLFGDWREEVIWRTNDNNNLRIYTTTTPTEYRINTLMHDPGYRLAIAWQNNSYNQPPHTSYYLGFDMFTPDSLWPPSSPRNLYSEDLNEKVRLFWDQNTDLDLAGYNLYRSENTAGPFDTINDSLLTEEFFLDTNVFNDTSYYYYVTAVDTDGNESKPSNIILSRPSNRPDYPTGIFTRSDIGANLVVWNEVNEDNIVGYNVYKSLNGIIDFTKLNDEPVTDTTFIDTPVSNSIKFYYAVVSENDIGVESFLSDVVPAQAGYTYTTQAEDEVLGGDYLVEEEHIGFNGTGYVNFSTTGSSVTFNYMPGFFGGEYVIVYRYALGNTDRTGSLVVNDVPQNLTMTGTGEWTNYVADSAVIELNTGFVNTIRFETTGSDFGNLDQITLKEKQFTNIDDHAISMKNDIDELKAVPNPFREGVMLNYRINEPCSVSVMIYNSQGQLIKSLVNRKYDIGDHFIEWDGRNDKGSSIPAGVYYCRLITSTNYQTSIKLVFGGQ